ncbi:MAG TPA: PQQ-binding-like beta-propeller repeat protein [Dehalococcoidia bacterium]|jgi:outer membrane protein assembly factor BamB|nr:PQQ-binding-like beta-propeller repeat protein [Dehalococcoidia bacterium]
MGVRHKVCSFVLISCLLIGSHPVLSGLGSPAMTTHQVYAVENHIPHRTLSQEDINYMLNVAEWRIKVYEGYGQWAYFFRWHALHPKSGSELTFAEVQAAQWNSLGEAVSELATKFKEIAEQKAEEEGWDLGNLTQEQESTIWDMIAELAPELLNLGIQFVDELIAQAGRLAFRTTFTTSAGILTSGLLSILGLGLVMMEIAEQSGQAISHAFQEMLDLGLAMQTSLCRDYWSFDDHGYTDAAGNFYHPVGNDLKDMIEKLKEEKDKLEELKNMAEAERPESQGELVDIWKEQADLTERITDTAQNANAWGGSDVGNQIVNDCFRLLSNYAGLDRLRILMYIDYISPPRVGNLTSSSHQIGTWSSDRTIDVNWSPPDGYALYPADGYSVSWDHSPSYDVLPDETIDTASPTFATPALANADDWYIHVRVHDAGGRWSPVASVVGPFHIDAPPSNLHSTTHAVNGWSKDDPIEVVWTPPEFANTTLAGYIIRWDQSPVSLPAQDGQIDPEKEQQIGAVTSTESPWLPHGDNYFHIRWIDSENNWSNTAAHLGPFKIDRRPPSGDIAIAEGTATNLTSVTLVLSASDEGCGLVSEMCFSNDNASWSPWESYARYKTWELAYGDGEKHVYVKYRDWFDNVSDTYSDSIILDTTPPIGTITVYPSGEIGYNQATFEWTGEDNISSTADLLYSYRLDSNPWSEWTSNTSITYTLTNGPHSFSVRAKDEVGNIEPTPPECSFAVSVEAIDWPMFRQNPARFGYSTSPAPDIGTRLWEFSTGGHGGSSPSVAGGKVFVGSADKLNCLNEETGGKIWEFTISGSCSTPAIANDRVYVGGHDGKVYCLDADTGEKIWKFSAGWVVRASPAISDNKVFIGAANKVYCLDGETGAKIWEFTAAALLGLSSPAVADGKVFISTATVQHPTDTWAYLYCLDEDTGQKIWEFRRVALNHQGYPPTVANGKVFVAYGQVLTQIGESPSGPKLYCLDEYTGAKIWEFDSGRGFPYRCPPVVADGKVFIGTGGILYCLDEYTGTKVWQFAGIADSCPAVADDKVLIGSRDKLYCLDADTGEKLWEVPGGGHNCYPTVANGKVFMWICMGRYDKIVCIGSIGDITAPQTSITSEWLETINYNDVTFTWSGQDDLTPTSELVYSYCLEGYDDDWSDWTSATSKEYNDLPEGSYKFKVKAKDLAGNPDPSPAEMSFTVVLFGEIEGWVYLQGRDNNSGATVVVNLGSWEMVATSDSEGYYRISGLPAGSYQVTIAMSGYLHADKGDVPVEAGEKTTLPEVILLGGDTDGDGDVDIFDLVIVASFFNLSGWDAPPPADIDGDAVVDIYDLVLVGCNYGKTQSSWPD